MTRYMVIGDVHGDISFASRISKYCKTLGIDTILQAGDFGIWDHRDDGLYFLNELNKTLTQRGQRIVFVPGNHENYDSLERHEAEAKEHGFYSPEGFVLVRPNIQYVTRGHQWRWDDRDFMGVGGAVSIDKAWRRPGSSWWPQEQLTFPEIKKIQSQEPVDILITHDCPTNAPFNFRLKPDLDSQMHRQKMDMVGAAAKATLWFHGHMHDQYDYEFQWGDNQAEVTRVLGLECNDGAMHGEHLQKRANVTTFGPLHKRIYNYAFLDTDTLTASWEE